MKIATGLDAEALYLQEFIQFYKPKFWRDRICDVDFAPYITKEEVEIILKGEIPIDNKFDKWYIREAIKEWLNKRNNNG